MIVLIPVEPDAKARDAVNPSCPKLLVSKQPPVKQRHFKNAAAKVEFYNRLAKQYATDNEVPANMRVAPDMRDQAVWISIFGEKRWREIFPHAIKGLVKEVPIKLGFTRHTLTSARQIDAMKEHKRERENARRAKQPKPKWHPTKAELAAA